MAASMNEVIITVFVAVTTVINPWQILKCWGMGWVWAVELSSTENLKCSTGKPGLFQCRGL